MQPQRHVPQTIGLALLLALFSASHLPAQTATTGTLTGLVVDDQGGVLPGADVVAVHEPTGTSYESTTNDSGRFQFLNVRVGGPYSLSVRLAGFREQVQRDIQVVLGQETAANFKLQLESITETITVSAESSSIYTGSRAGAATSVESQALETLPTLNRSLQDFARLSPFVNTNPTSDDGPATISVAGRPNRYNNVQIDGAVNNDVFGLADSGTPGGQTEVQPISLDAIQELQVSVSPYDVRQGGFAGGGVNAITRSGSNRLRGSGYIYWRDQTLVGKGPSDIAVGTFNDKEGGGSLGGPIVKNRAFAFGNFEIGRRNTPSGYSIDGESGIPFGRQAEAQRFRSILVNKYGYDPGGFEQFTRETPNNKVFVRGDFNMGRHQLIVRHNYVDARNDRGFPSSTEYIFPDNYYQIRDKTNSTVVQLNSTFGTSFNEFRVSYQTIKDRRDGETRFPSIFYLERGISFRAGREFSSHANELDQDVIEINDDFTMVRGSHTFTLGTHNEFFDFRNLFIQGFFGDYRFDTLDLLEQGLAQSFTHGFSNTADPLQAAKFSIRQFGFYTGDQWRVQPRLTLTYGVRFDYPVFPDEPTRNPASEQYFGYRTDEVPTSPMWSPRLGFNWDLTREAMRQQVRGGVGLFAGRTPYVWLSNQYGNTGIEFTRLQVLYNANNRVPFVADPDNQPTSLPGGTAATNEIDVVDPDYKFPSLLRGNIGYDRQIFWHLNATVELLWGLTVNDIAYKNLNLAQVGTAPDGRPRFARPVPSLANVILLENTDQGSQWSLAFKLDRPFRNGFYVGGSYLYNDARSVNDGTSSTASSQWNNVRVPGDPNDPPLTRSHFAVGHRITLSGSYEIPLGKGFTGTASLFYNGQSGRTYSPTFNGDINGDGQTGNDLIYVPQSASEVEVRNGTWADLENYINEDECLSENRGQIVERNCARGPWTNSLDFRFAVGLPLGPVRTDLTFDLINLINVFDNDSGVYEYPPFWRLQPIQYRGVNSAGQMIYDIAAIFRPKYTTDNLRSRWQGKFGVRLRF